MPIGGLQLREQAIGAKVKGRSGAGAAVPAGAQNGFFGAVVTLQQNIII